MGGFTQGRAVHVGRWPVIVALSLLAIVASGSAGPPSADASTLPAGFFDRTVISGLNRPTAFAISNDGRVFIAAKSGIIREFDLNNPSTPAVTVADLRLNVYDVGDSGLLGLTLDPNFPSSPYLYVAYGYDAPIGGTAPTYGSASGDSCPTPPGPTNGCITSGRVSRLTIDPATNVMVGSEDVLINDWCQQYQTHSLDDLAFGADGNLYVSGGDGGSAGFTDYGQKGTPANACGDPPGGPGVPETIPTAEGGSLHAQDLLTMGDPATLDGAVIRIDPVTGAGAAGNPLSASTDPGARRIVAEGLRNPFRLAVQPGTNDVWVGDVGWHTWEEIDHVAMPEGSVADFGWPCYEGRSPQPSWQGLGLNLCQTLYNSPAGTVTNPTFTYNHANPVVTGDGCPTANGSALGGIAFGRTANSPYPAGYNGALFFADYARQCIWAMKLGAGGQPDPTNVSLIEQGAPSPVAMHLGPDGKLYYVSISTGTLHVIDFSGSNQPPNAVISASPTSGPAPLTVQLSGSGSSDPNPGDTLSYSWDLNGDGQFGDSTAVTPPQQTYPAGAYDVSLKVTDQSGASDTATVHIVSGDSAPTVTIDSPAPSLTWSTGDIIQFSGHAVDGAGNPIPASGLSWTVILHHCPTGEGCHLHYLESPDGVSSGAITAPDHDYPSFLELQLTATDSGGLSNTASVTIYPKHVQMTMATAPSGLTVSANADSGPAPLVHGAIVGATTTISAPSPQIMKGIRYDWKSWSDGGSRVHDVAAPSANHTYTASFFASTGGNHDCAIGSTGTIRCWGDNSSGQTTAPTGTFRSVSAGGGHTCAITLSSSVRCWGRNDHGQATPPTGSFRQVSAGVYSSCGVRTTGVVACWGDNSTGETAAPAGTFTSVSAGGAPGRVGGHACAIRTDGTVACWGDNSTGESSPSAGTFTQVSAGYANTCGLRTAGTVACWGDDAFGQSSAPAGTFTQISVGYDHACGVLTGGNVACWGDNSSGQATPPAGAFVSVSARAASTCGLRVSGTISCWGLNTAGQAKPPTSVFAMPRLAAGDGFECAVQANGTAACWGNNALGQSSPPGGTFLQVSAGSGYACGIQTSGNLACWGSNSLGQATPPSGTFTQLSAGKGHACAVRTDGTAACWGDNGLGQATPPAGTFIQVSAGASHSCGVMTGGAIACWGDTSFGKTTAPSGTFLQVVAGGNHTCALNTKSTVSCWGDGSSGKTTAPTGGMTQISAGLNHTCGIQLNSAIRCWGSNSSGQSKPPSGTAPTPTGPYASVAAGSMDSCGVRASGSVVCWGDNSFGERGSPPHITLQPTNQAGAIGAQVTFAAAASGGPTPTVQWQSEPAGKTVWTAIAGATSPQYTFTVTGSYGEKFRAVFSNLFGTSTSTAATLLAPP